RRTRGIGDGPPHRIDADVCAHFRVRFHAHARATLVVVGGRGTATAVARRRWLGRSRAVGHRGHGNLSGSRRGGAGAALGDLFRRTGHERVTTALAYASPMVP